MRQPPRFEHEDCSGCHYLGRFERYDLYYCTSEPTVICRYSSEGGDYNTGYGLTFVVTSDKICYTEALIRALQTGQWREQIIKYFKYFDRVCLELDHEELVSLGTPVVVEGWEKRKGGRVRRAWLAQFDANERRKAVRYYNLFYRWYLIKSIPQSYVFRSAQLDFIRKLVAFFGGI